MPIDLHTLQAFDLSGKDDPTDRSKKSETI
jgi:hypothetical protein